MKMKALLMAPAVVVCATTSADFLPPAAKAQAIKAAATLNNLLVATGATTLCIDPEGACHWAASSARTTCLGNAHKAKNNCTSACAENTWTAAKCLQACNETHNNAIDACDDEFDDAVAACRSG